MTFNTLTLYKFIDFRGKFIYDGCILGGEGERVCIKYI